MPSDGTMMLKLAGRYVRTSVTHLNGEETFMIFDLNTSDFIELDKEKL